MEFCNQRMRLNQLDSGDGDIEIQINIPRSLFTKCLCSIPRPVVWCDRALLSPTTNGIPPASQLGCYQMGFNTSEFSEPWESLVQGKVSWQFFPWILRFPLL